MKNIVIVALIALLIVSPVSLNGMTLNNEASIRSFAPPVLTEREAAMVAYNNFADEAEIAEGLKIRVTKVENFMNSFNVNLALVSVTDGTFVRKAAQYQIDGTTGEIITSVKFQESRMSIEEALSFASVKNLTKVQAIAIVDTFSGSENELIKLILTDLSENCGDSLDNFILLAKMFKSNQMKEFIVIETVSNNIASAVFSRVTSGEFEAGRQTMRLMNELKTI